MALENILSQEIVQKLGWTLIHFVWQAAAVVLLLSILLAVLRKSSANVRYIIACTAMGLIVLLPIITIQLVPVSTPEPVTSIESQPAHSIVTVQTTIEEIPSTGVTEYKEPIQRESTDVVRNVSWKQRAVEWFEPALPYLVTGWLLGVFGLSLWHLGGWAQLQRLKKQMVKRVNASLQVKLNELSGRLKVKQAVQLLESALVQVPTVVGWLRPVILLPASALTGLTTEQLEALLAHELAHIRRYDYLVNMLQTVIETLGFYHPAVWWISYRIRAERENCCDDLAVSIYTDRVRYARALTSMEEIRASYSKLAVAASGGNLFGRIHRLVRKDSTESSRTSWLPSVISILMIAIIIIPTTLALTGQSENKSDADTEMLLIKGFCENRDKFKCGFLAWSADQRNEIVTEGPRTGEKGTYQMWWDGKKITTKYAQERTDLDADKVTYTSTGGNVYDGKLFSKKPRFEPFENWFGRDIINWTGPMSVDQEIPMLRKRRNVETNFSMVNIDSRKLIKFSTKNINKTTVDFGAYSISYFDLSKGYCLVNEESYTADNRLRRRSSYKLKEVIPDGWFPVEVEVKGFSLKDGKVYMQRCLALDLERCRFNDPSAITDGIFDFSANKEHEQLNDILKKFSNGAVSDKSDDNVKSPLESVETFIAAALAGDDEKAATFIDRRRDGYEQVKSMREVLSDQQIRILSVTSTEWNALVITSVVQADHGRTGSIVFHLKKVILDQKVRWLIDDIDLEAVNTIEQAIKRFIERNPDAKTIIINSNNYANKQTNTPPENENRSQTQKLRSDELPTQWSLKYIDGSDVGSNLAVLKAVPKPIDENDESWKQERLEFRISSYEGLLIKTIHFTEKFQHNQVEVKPGKYLLKYERSWGKTGDNYRIRREFPVDLSRPGTYELQFTPKLGTAKITGSLGGCYSINFEKDDEGSWIRGFAYQYPSKQYILDGLPPGKYSLSAVAMRGSPNVIVSQAKVTVGTDDKAIVNIAPVPRGSCSLKGDILGRQKNYKTPWPTWPESEGKWYVLIRKPGSGKVGKVEAYEALTMDSLYVVRGQNITQDTKNKASYHIEGLLPGEYTVTAIEHPSWGGCTILRQLSQTLVLKESDQAVLDFDLRDVPKDYTPAAAETKNLIASDEGSIEGRIIDIDTGKGISGVQLAAVPRSSSSYYRFTCTSEKDGKFAIDGLQSGEYLIRGDFPSVDVDVVSGRCTRDVLIGINRRKTPLTMEEESIARSQYGDVQILIDAKAFEIPAEKVHDIFEPSESLSNEILLRNGHEIVYRLLALTQEHKEARLIASPQVITLSGREASMSIGDTTPNTLGPDSTGASGSLMLRMQSLLTGNDISDRILHLKLSVGQKEPILEPDKAAKGYEGRASLPGRYFSIKATAKNNEPIIVGRLRPGKPALCLAITQSASISERQPDYLIGKKLPQPDNIQNIDSFKQIEGKSILICFWDSQQRPSRNFISELAKRGKELADKNVAVYLIHTSKIDSAKLKEWLDNRNTSFACGSIKDNVVDVLFRWGVRAQPWLILTNENGVVQAEGFSIEQLDEKLQAKESNLSLEDEEAIQNPEDQTNILYRGLVRDEKGDPIAGAKVCWFSKQSGGLSLNLSEQWNNPDVLTTDKRGEFTFRNVYGNNIGIYVKAEGYAQYMVGPLVLPRIIGPLFDPGDSKKLKQIVLQPGADVFGKVLEDGQGVVGARISANIFSAQLHKMLDSPWPCITTKTDEIGFYRLVDLPAGQFSIGVNSPTAKGNLNIAQKQINLEPGDRTELNFGDEEGFTLTGVVTVDGEAVEIASVRIQLPNESVKWGRTDRNGNFRITGISNGQHELFTTYDKDLDPVTFLWGKDGKQVYDTRYDRRQITIENDTSVEIHIGKQRSSDISLAKSAAPSAEDKSIVKVDLAVVEVPAGSEVDRETAAEIRKLLGSKITIPDPPNATDLLRKAAEATAASKDESAGDKRITQEEFNTLFDLLVSRGYVKILMRPPLEVADGQTAQIMSEQKIPSMQDSLEDSIQIRPHVSKDDNIILLEFKAIFSTQTIPQSEEQKPIINTNEITTMIRLSPGESGIIGGTQQTGLITKHSKDVKDSKVPATEIFVILTPTIIASVKPQEPMETVNFKNIEARMIIEKLAEWTDKTIIPTDELMKQKITIYSPQQIPRSEAAAMILNALCSKGYTAEQTDDTIYLKPLPEEQHDKEAKDQPTDKFITRVYDISDLVYIGERISRGTVDVTMEGSGSMMGRNLNISDQAIVNEAQKVVNHIMQKIDQNSWFQNNPNAIGTISPYPAARPRKLAIYQTLHAHQQIKELLFGRREKTDTTQISIELRYLYTNMEFLNEVRDSMGIEFTPDTFLDDKQLGTLLRASQKNRNIKAMAPPIVKVLNYETAQFKTVRQVFMSFLDYYKLNNAPKQSQPMPVDTFCSISSQIEDDNIIIDFIQDIPGLQERIIYDRREMVQPYTETSAITNKLIPKNKTLAFTCDIKKVDQDNQTVSSAEKKTLIVLIKPTIIEQEEMPREEAVMILNSPRTKGDTAEQSDETIYIKSLPEEHHGKEAKEPPADNQQDRNDIKDEDTPNKEYEVIQLNYIDAVKAANRLKQVLQQTPELQKNVHFQPLEQTQQIIIFGNPDMREMVKELIAEIDQQVGHSEKLSKLGKALLTYANEHDGRYPDSIAQVKQYLETEEFAWAQQNVTYYGKGRTVADLPDMRLARDNRQAIATKGTNSLFNDGRVEFTKPGRQKDRGTDKDQILIDTKILTTSDEFMRYIGLEPNSVASSEGWSDYLVHSTEDSASFVVDQLHTDLLLRNVAARMRTHKDVRVLHKPQVLAQSGKECEIYIVESEYYMLRAPKEPNALSGESESKSNRIDLGTTIRMVPTLTPDGDNVELDFEWEYRRLRGFKEHTGPDGKVQKVPQIDIDRIKTPCTIPDGKTLLIAGKKIIEQKKKKPRKPQLADLPLIGRFFYSPPQPEQTKNLLIMVTPRTCINKPLKPQTPRSIVNPNDPLIKKLEEKFKRYDEQK